MRMDGAAITPEGGRPTLPLRAGTGQHRRAGSFPAESVGTPPATLRMAPAAAACLVAAALTAFVAVPPVVAAPQSSEGTRRESAPDPLYLREAHSHRIEPAGGEQERLPEGLRPRTGSWPFPSDTRDLDTAATEAGRWSASQRARTTGMLIYYRGGFHDGLHGALGARPDAAIDYVEGLRQGARDPGALEHGRMAGAAGAEEIARSEATRIVEAQFMDLSRAPAYVEPAGAPQGRIEVPAIVAPPLEDLLSGVEAAHVPGLSRSFADAFDGWSHDPWSLHRASRYAEFLELDWAEPQAAFDDWLSGRKRSAEYRALNSPADRDRFRAVFLAAYSTRLAMLLEDELAASYRVGRRDGWRFGAVAVAEWRYRLGYAEGFNQTALTSASATYAALYPEALRRQYDDRHQFWSGIAVPGIVSLRIDDGSDDGIFQPGEQVLVRAELANYGGSPGSWSGFVESAAFEAPVRIDLSLPPRRSTAMREPATARIRATTERGARVDVVLSGDELSSSLPLVVSYPLQFTGRARLAQIDVLAGRAGAEVEVVNRSRRVIDGEILLAAGAPAVADGPTRSVEAIVPGEIRSIVFQLAQVEPLDALSGDVELRFEARSAGTLNDELGYSLPAVAFDLESSELERFLVELAMDESPPGHNVRRALDLAIERIARDWEAVAAMEGNPYKDDYEQRAGTTALGGLVRLYHEKRARMRNRDLFIRLGGEIEGLVDELPGVHPFLRKYFLRLARQLG